MMEVQDEINILLTQLSGDIIYQLEDYSEPLPKKEKNPLGRRNNVVFCYTRESLLSFREKLNSENFDSNSYFLIVSKPRDLLEIPKVLSVLYTSSWATEIPNLLMMIHIPGNPDVILYTYFPYQTNVCRYLRPHVINSYDLQTHKWKNHKFYGSKTHNMSGCPLRIATFNFEPFMMVNKNDEGKLIASGIEGDLLNFLSETIDFTPEIILADEKWGEIYDNGTSSGATEMIVNKEADIAIGYFISHPNRESVMFSSLVYYTSNAIWAVPPGEMYTALEKLMKPFDTSLWIGFFIVLILAFLIIEIINFCPEKIQDFVYGEKIRNVRLNVVNVMLEVSLPKIPARNFARTVLILFVVYCFLMSNSYKGSLFNFMQKDLRNPPLDSTEKLLQNNFNFYAMSASETSLNATQNIFKRTSFVDDEKIIEEIYDNLTDSSFKNALLVPEESWAYKNIHSESTINYNRAKDVMFQQNMVIYMNKLSIFKVELDKRLRELVCYGFIDMWAKKYTTSGFSYTDSTQTTKQLNLEHLEGAFLLVAVGWFLCIFIFLFELFYFKLKKLLKKN
ncbi:CLUMA_CG007926, isoform A [Clunio marinus]|uniref:CLUMA_CG007926, isoform A n=1 Tax=Clunio marinus TaxID=568069 RepID=A0A1J1I2I3_9DIPT|nr:CLUMA_CG007926, isoform A [Clunio marinus]